MVRDDARIDALRGTILGCAIEVHRRMGPGLLESVYKTCLVIELRLAPVHKAQVITYLKLANRPAGLLLNFNSVLLKDGIRRIVHPDLYETPPAPASSSTTEH